MESHRLFLGAVALAALCGCGGAESLAPVQEEEQAEIHFVIDYILSQSSLFPAGTVQVSPPSGSLTIGQEPVTKVELLLFGYDKQVLTEPNFSPRDNPQLRYVFRLPETFVGGSYLCTGMHLSEVRVTMASGVTASKVFEICPGTALQVRAP